MNITLKNYSYSIAVSFIIAFSIAFMLTGCENTNARKAVQEAKKKIDEARIRKEINADKKQKAIEAIMATKIAQGFNGNVLVAQKGVIVYENSVGFANFEDTVKLTTDSKFQLASLSKTFTSVAVMKLVDEGKLSLTSTVKDYFPAFPYDGVTIHSLLCHRSGLPYYEYLMDKEVKQKAWYPTNQEVIQWFATQNPAPVPYNLPDHFFSYNNTNFAILAAVVEKVAQQPYETYLRKNILLPLGMNDTFDATTPNDSINKNRTFGYQNGRRIPTDYYDKISGDKGIYSTTHDLLKWYESLRDGSIVSKESLREMFTPRSFEHPGLRNYGYGFRLWVDEQQRTDYVYHTGWWKGYNTIMFFDLREDFVVILLSNRFNRSVYQIRDIVDTMHDGKKPSTVEENILDS